MSRPVPNQMPSTDPDPVRLALIGENPGPDEVALGYPFAGKSGWKLNEWLAVAGISRSQCFVGNVSQCRPPGVTGGVAPNEFHLFEWNGSEIQEGIAALREDLARFRPNIVVGLGNAALHLLRQGNVSPGKSAKLGLFQWMSHVGTWRGSLFRAAASFDAFEASDLRIRSGRCPVVAPDAPTTPFPAPPHSNAVAATSTSPPMPSILPNASGINELRAGPATNPVQASVTAAGGSPCAFASPPPLLSVEPHLTVSIEQAARMLRDCPQSLVDAGWDLNEVRHAIEVASCNPLEPSSNKSPYNQADASREGGLGRGSQASTLVRVQAAPSSLDPLGSGLESRAFDTSTEPGGSSIFKALATYHPAATFREPSFVFPLVSDLKRAVAEARTPDLFLPERRIRWGLSVDELESECAAIRARKAPVGHDIEGGLGGLHCASFATSPSDAFVVDLMALHGDGPRTYAAIASVLEDASVPKVLWNAAYERAIWEAVASVTIRNYEDGMIAWWERFSELPKGLDFVASILTREPYWAEGIGWDKKTGMPKVTGPPFLTYNALDSLVTLEIWQSKLIREVVESRTPVAFTV